MIPNIGPLEIGVLAVIALVVFGPKRLPELGSSAGKAIRGFGRGMRGEDEQLPEGEEPPAVARPERSGRA